MTAKIRNAAAQGFPVSFGAALGPDGGRERTVEYCWTAEKDSRGKPHSSHE